jgi:hypothetical protein
VEGVNSEKEWKKERPARISLLLWVSSPKKESEIGENKMPKVA